MRLKLTCVQPRLQPLKRLPAQKRPRGPNIHREPALVVRLQHRVRSHRNERPQGLPVMPACENRPHKIAAGGGKIRPLLPYLPV